MSSEATGRPAHRLLSVQPVAELGGSDRALLRLATQLGAAGWAVHIAMPGPSPLGPDLDAVGATVHVVPMRRISTSHSAKAWAAYALAWPGTVARLWRLARRLDVDAVHSNSLHSWYGWAVALLAGKPHLWHAREIVTQSGAALAVERFLARHFARRVFAVSVAVAAQLSPTNVIVVHEEPGPDECSPGRAGRARARYGLADDALLVGYVGRIDTWKGVDVFLASLPLLATAHPGTAGASGITAVVAGGLVAGKETYAAGLEREAADTGAAWLGPLPAEDAGDLIADLDCLVYPSTGPEPWGLVIVEALACGVPVVSTDAGGPREITAGLLATSTVLVPPGDPVALAEAVSRLLPAATSTELRRARPVLRAGAPPPYDQLFSQVLG